MTTLASHLKRWGNHFWPHRFHPYALAERKVRRVARGRVLAGPFAGMKLAPSSICSAFQPKMLGTYEAELNPLIEELCACDFKCIINVGAAEGYFAVGMALRCLEARVHAFETEPEGRELLRQMAVSNQVSERVEIHGCCTEETLESLLRQQPRALVIMDVEGAEEGLLRPKWIPPACRVLVELHEFIVPGIGREISGRFRRTHTIREIHSRDRTVEDLPFRSLLLDRWLIKLTREFRPAQMSWLDMKGREGIDPEALL